MKKSVLILMVLIFSLACSTKELEQEAKIDLYFDLEGTLDLVIQDLMDQKAGLKKETTVNDESDEFSIEPTSLDDWKAQLELFYEADINKVGLSNSYQVETLQAIDGIEKKIYSAMDASSYVRSIECTYRDEKLFSVRIIASDKNLVYSSNSEFILYFNHFKRKLALDHFSINTSEKMLFKKDLDLSVVAEVVLP